MKWEDELKKEPFEDKFIVINRKDLDYLNEQGKEELQVILMAISMGRTHDHKKQNDYYVCNQDEPYAQMIIDIILTKGQSIQSLLKQQRENCVKELIDCESDSEKHFNCENYNCIRNAPEPEGK